MEKYNFYEEINALDIKNNFMMLRKQKQKIGSGVNGIDECWMEKVDIDVFYPPRRNKTAYLERTIK